MFKVLKVLKTLKVLKVLKILKVLAVLAVLQNITIMTVIEFDYPLPNNVKARDPVGSNKKNMDNKISLKTQIRFSLHSKENISFKNCCLLRCSNLYTICVE